MTLEASLVLPLCLFFLINLGSSVEMIRLHNRIQLAILDAGNTVALYGSEQGESVISSLIATGYVKNKVVTSCDKEYLNASPITGGAAGLHLWESNALLQPDELDLSITYGVEPPYSIVGQTRFRMANRYYTHLWNGYDPNYTEKESGVYYFAEYGDVYHTDRNCSHLTLRIKCIDSAVLSSARNHNGQKYTSCDRCAEGEMPEFIYITEEGYCFHYSETCAGLKRTVTIVPAEAVKGYRICERCGKEE